MKYTLSQQIDAIQKARELVIKTSLDPNTHESNRSKWGEVANKLNDAGSTIAALNLNPELKKYFNDNTD